MTLALLMLACSFGVREPMNLSLADAPVIRLRLPVGEPELLLDRVMGVDHDPDEYEGVEQVNCIAYDGSGYPNCYDQHDGSDFDLIQGFTTMDEGSATVVASADGVVEVVTDGNYDRCHLDTETWGPDCDGHPIKSNHVWLVHPGGWRTYYTHMMKDSIVVQVGETVVRGQMLGKVGSSGWSTAPHVHLELWDPADNQIDPFAGAFSQDESYWCDQDGPNDLPGTDCG